MTTIHTSPSSSSTSSTMTATFTLVSQVKGLCNKLVVKEEEQEQERQGDHHPHLPLLLHLLLLLLLQLLLLLLLHLLLLLLLHLLHHGRHLHPCVPGRGAPQALPSPGEQAVLKVEGCAAAGESDLDSKLSRDYQEKQVYLLTPLLF